MTTVAGFWCDGLIDNEKVASSTKKSRLQGPVQDYNQFTNSRSPLGCKNHILLKTKMTKIDTLFKAKMAEKPYHLDRTYLHSTYRKYPLGSLIIHQVLTKEIMNMMVYLMLINIMDFYNFISPIST